MQREAKRGAAAAQAVQKIQNQLSTREKTLEKWRKQCARPSLSLLSFCV